jgi:predicted nucleotidyltransferase
VVTSTLINKGVKVLVDEFGAEQVILFGSRARGDAHAKSDVDLLVIRPLRGSRMPLESRMLLAMGELGLPSDLVLITPKEFEEQKALPGTIARAAYKEGKVLHASA